MNKNPLLSIIVVTYNSEKTLEECLASLFMQTFTNWELVVIDGLSTDSTITILKKYQHKINFLLSEKDSGIYDAMNKGANNSKGKYLYFLNSDDELFDKEVLDDVSKYLDNRVELLTANVLKTYKKHSILKSNRLTAKNLKKGLMPPHQSMFIKKSFFDSVGGYANKYKSSGDFEFCCKIFKYGVKLRYLNRKIAFFRAGGMSSNKKIAYFETFRIIDEYFGRYYAAIFYVKKIILEQGIKKIIKHLV